MPIFIPLAKIVADVPQTRPQTGPGGFQRPGARGTGTSRRRVKKQTIIPQAYENPVDPSFGVSEVRTEILGDRGLAAVRH